MQHLILFLLPLLAFFLSFLFFRKIRIVEIAIACLVGVVANFTMSELMKSDGIMDTEYASFYAVHARYFQSWDEWVSETCQDENGVEYDCSHSVWHDARWDLTDNGGISHPIERSEYEAIVRHLNMEPVFADMQRDYYTKDGDMYYVEISPQYLLLPITRKQEYMNKILANQSLYHYDKVSDRERDSLGLFDYPPIVSYDKAPYPQSLHTFQPVVLGYNNEWFNERMTSLNGAYGKQYQLQTYMFFYYEKGRELAQRQINYLQLGNFNEHLIMLGVQQGGEITWCETHSWEDVPSLRTNTKQWFTENNHLDSLYKFIDWYAWQVYMGQWKTKDYHDFDYIRISLTLTQMAWLVAIQLLLQTLALGYMYFFYRTNEKLKHEIKDYKMRDDYLARKEVELKKFMVILSFTGMLPVMAASLSVLWSYLLFVAIALCVPVVYCT